MCTAAVEDDRLINYSISWSTQASRCTGIVRPRALAVFRLMMNWYLVVCGTGSSATLCSIACADAGGLYYPTPLVDFRLKQRSEPFRRRAFDNDAEWLEPGPYRGFR